jgi:hypothetical protein
LWCFSAHQGRGGPSCGRIGTRARTATEPHTDSRATRATRQRQRQCCGPPRRASFNVTATAAGQRNLTSRGKVRTTSGSDPRSPFPPSHSHSPAALPPPPVCRHLEPFRAPRTSHPVLSLELLVQVLVRHPQRALQPRRRRLARRTRPRRVRVEHRRREHGGARCQVPGARWRRRPWWESSGQ